MAGISKTGISNGGTIDASHITRIIEALDGTGSAEIYATGSFTGSFIGSFTGNGNGLTNVTASSATSASYALTASFLTGTIQSASFATSASLSVSSSFATSASRATSAATATSSSVALSSNQLVSVRRSVSTFQTNNASPVVQNLPAGFRYARYIKAIVIGNSASGSLGGEFTRFYDYDGFGEGVSLLSSTGTLSENIGPGTPSFSLIHDQWTAYGVAGVSIDWQVILEYSDVTFS